MTKEFNDTGSCNPIRHYIVDISAKIEKILELVQKGKYFTINRPHQYGKTSVLSMLAKRINHSDDSIALKISFEDIDAETYRNPANFINEFLQLLKEKAGFLNLPVLEELISQSSVTNIPSLSRFITGLIKRMLPEKQVILLIDEVDKSTNNELFLDFLGMLRSKYLKQNEGEDYTFQSVILAGVHDIKTIKMKISPDTEKKYNSPWNIAIDFKVDLNFSPSEIATMLTGYANDKNIDMNIKSISEKLYYYTSGYPYLNSKLCKFIDEDIISNRDNKNWSPGDVEQAFKLIVKGSYTTTLFDSLIKNLENNRELYDTVFDLVINGRNLPFTIADPIINLASMYGIIVESPDGCKIHNRIFEQRIYEYMMTKILRTRHSYFPSFDYYTETGLNLKLILQKFQLFMKENYSHKDRSFLEREGRLLFLAFLKPILNGKGFDFKEPNVADERRMDLVISYGTTRYVVELKRWAGLKTHEKGLKQLSDYLDIYSLKQGWLLIYNFNKKKEYKEKMISFGGKKIFAVWV